MSDSRQLVFRDHDTLGGIAPTIDGFALVDAGVVTDEPVESGYINAGRVSLGPGVLPPVVLQAVRHNDTLVLAISCRGDPSFDDADAITIALRQNGNSEDGPQRRIDIVPVWGDEPAPPYDPANLGIGYGAANRSPDPTLHAFEVADIPAFDIRTNKPPHLDASYFRRDIKTGPWTPFTPALHDNTAKFDARVRSWKPTVAANSPIECAWGIELRFPLGTAGGTGDWIDLADDFGIFIDVIRAFRYLDGPDLLYDSVQFTFPVNAPGFSNITLGPNTDVTPDRFGHGLKGGAVSQGIGVRIKNDAYGIGRRARGDLAAPLGNSISKTVDNDIVAQLENTGPAASGIRAEVRMWNYGLPPATFNLWDRPNGCQQPSPSINLAAGTTAVPTQGETINHWDAALVGPEYPAGAHQCMWIQLDATTPVVFSQSSVRRNMDFTQLSSVTRDVTISGAGYPKPADGSAEHDFLLMTRCRKIVVKELVGRRHVDPLTLALVTGALQQRDVDAKARDDGAVAHTVMFDKAMAAGAGTGQQWENSVVYLWITEGYRRTNDFLIVNGIKTRVLDNSPGDFGLIAHHEGVNDGMNWTFMPEGTKMVQYGPGLYGVRVPDKGQVKIVVRLGAGPDEKPGDRSSLPPPDGKPPGSGGDGSGGPTTPPDLPKGCLALLMGIFGKKHP